MKKIATTLFLALGLWLTAQAQSCLPEGITFTSQGQVDSFPINYPGCTTLGGNLTIQGDSITSLSGLSTIQSIVGSLNIAADNQLTSFNGLNNLISIDSNLQISGSTPLVNFIGLDNLVFIGRSLLLDTLSDITGFTGLTSLTTVGGDIFVKNCDKFEGFAGLSSIVTLGGIKVQYCPLLQNFNGLKNITALTGDLFIWNNWVLTSLTGLEQITSIGGDATFKGCPLSSMSGLSNLNQVTGKVYIFNNLELSDLTGLNHLQSVGSLLISYNNLESFAGFDALNVIKGEFGVQGNWMLTNLDGLHHVKSIDGTLYIALNQALATISGLDSLHTIGGDLNITSNSVLTNLSGLTRLDSIGADLIINLNNSLGQLTGLEGVHTVASDLVVANNKVLTNIMGLYNIQFVGRNLNIFSNDSLSNCAIYPVCNQIFHSPEFLYITNNDTGCNTPAEVEISCGGLKVVATIYLDNNGNCEADTSDALAEGAFIQLSSSLQQTLHATQSNGSTQFGYLNVGALTLSLPQFPNTSWQVCQDSISFLPDTILEDTIRATFLLQPLNQCPQLTVDLGLPAFFRGCLASTPMEVTTRNVGTINAESVQVAVVMPVGLELGSSNPILSSQSGDTLFFNLGEIPPFRASTVHMEVKTSCTGVQMGQAICLEAFSSLTNPCSVTTPPSSEIRLFSECLSDTTVRFTIKNVGNAATQNVHDYVIIEDEVILRGENFSLNASDQMLVDVPSTGATYRMEATKYEDGTQTATAIENCGGFTPGLITAYWLNDGQRSYDFDCRIVRLAFDPNQKTAIPTGVGPDHLLAANKSIQYTIEFQNTGTDTAFRVLVRDVLPPQLNVLSFRPGYASNPYTWQILGNDTLEVLFFPIMLPDSNVNEATSHGWFTFDIEQQPDLPDGTLIENIASIIFDYNPPIVTNTVLHTIGKLTVSVDEPQGAGQTWQVLSNPARYAATFRSRTFIPGVKRFELTDAMGRVVRTEHFDGQEFVFQRGELLCGLYYFRIYDAQGKGAAGKIVLSE